ncbi:TerD family protein [Streptomyces boninensis]|uniref:TerD family protein n=1 Tax=Streptomyces boninensis TaxID=2039455 RepID=UPI003B218F01
MTQAMAKGSNLTVQAAAVRAVLRWTPGVGVPDVDASLLLIGDEGTVRSDEDFVFYNQPRHPSGLARKLPKKRHGDRYTDTVEAQLARQPASVDQLVLAASTDPDDPGTFGQVKDLRLELHDALAPAGAGAAEPFAYFDIAPETGSESALICGEFYRRGGEWKFRALGQGYESGLIGLATEFGVAVDESPAGEPAAAASAPAASAAASAPAAGARQPAAAYGYPPAFTLPPQGPQFIGR